jgi:hypothetical protein
MANSLSNLNREFWSQEMQKTLFVENTAVFLAGTEAQAALAQDGRKFHKPILSKPSTGTYSPGSDIDDKDFTSSDEELEVDTFKYASVYIDDTEKKQNYYSAAENAAMSMMRQLNNITEQAFLGDVTNAKHTVDAGSVGGSSGDGIEFSAVNASRVFTAAHTKLDLVDAPMNNRVAVIGPHMVGVLREAKSGRETGLGDSVLANGIIGPWQGWTVVQNNNLPWSGAIEIAADPTDDDTVTVAGVTFTFKDPIGTAAGDVLIDGENTKTYLSYAINGSGGTEDTNWVDVSSEDRFILSEKRNITATVNGDDVDLTGYGDIVVTSHFTNQSNLVKEQAQSAWFGIRGATDLAIQMPANVEVTRVEARFGDRIKALLGYGVKTFADGARGLVKVSIDASDWS